MQTAREIMTPNPITVKPEDSIANAVKILLDKHFNGMPVVNDAGELMGVLCQSDLVAQQKKLEFPSVFTIFDGIIPFGSNNLEKDLKKITALTVKDAMTVNPVTASPDALLEDIATLMVKAKYYSLPVVENGKVIGIIGKEDILRTVVFK